jgi:uncharacterized protein with FMN-binding domain
MRRAVIATAGTVVGLVALLDYRSSSTIGRSNVAVGRAGSAPSATTAAPTATPTTTAPTSGTTTPGSAQAGPTPATTSPAATSSGRYTGVDVPYNYGDIQLRITVTGGKITAIDVPQESATDPRSQSINSQAVPILVQEALAAQNLNFDVVSGATFTSDAFAQAFQSALTKAGK